ncbi:Response regulator [Rubrivivax sp. A210]|uniref:response regulator n=1 Tax=Rubrivivax sp. A210 TaxID=2772301 RepID=UPI00191B5897|nr:response regulator [Rubrivivax sp. A210]CAD5369713.1 Response regulator [Rubrivivax sp. A210]
MTPSVHPGPADRRHAPLPAAAVDGALRPPRRHAASMRMGSGQARAQPVRATGKPPGTSKSRVLCVDDEPSILRSLTWLLQKQFDVDTASSGAEAMALVQAASYDVVISDQRMPGMMGSELLREVRRVSPRSMRILLTGYSDLQALLRSVNEGEVFRFVNKPWKFPELLQVVEEAARIAREAPALIALADPSDATVDLKGERILVVDDQPEMARLVREAVGAAVGLVRATTLAAAEAAFDNPGIGIIVSNMRVGGVDASRLLKQLKARHPAVVAVVYTDATDAIDVIGLINQAQILRFLPKPVKPTTLKLALAAAAAKRQQWRDNPALLQRHAVQQPGQAPREAFAGDTRPAALQPPRPATLAGLGRRLANGWLRLFGRG